MDKVTANGRYKVVKGFVMDACGGDLDSSLDMLEQINRRICRFSKTHENFMVVRCQSESPNTSKNKLIVDAGAINEKLELVAL